MSWSENDIEVLVDEHFRGLMPKCPQDQTRLRVQENKYIGQRTADLFLRCPRCGACAQWQADGTAIEPVWSPAEQRKIVDDYWQNGVARCPVDDAVLSVDESQEVGLSVTPILAHCFRCGRHLNSTDVPAADALEDVSFAGRYDVIRQLARGGMGSVDLVRDRRSKGLFAAKTILPDKARDPNMVDRFRREIHILRGLEHPSIVRVVDDFVESGKAIYVMEYMEGGNLADAITDPKRDARDLVRLFRGAAEGLAFLHEKGVIHRDLKAKNIVIGADGRARLCDFGVSVLVERDTPALTRTGERLGTPLYYSPEQLRGARDLTSATDIYSFGLIAIEVVRRRVLDPDDDPKAMYSGSDPLAKALTRALAFHPKDRTISPGDLADAVLARVESDEETTMAGAGAASENAPLASSDATREAIDLVLRIEPEGGYESRREHVQRVLLVEIANRSEETLAEYRVELEIPAEVIDEPKSYKTYVPERSTATTVFLRATERHRPTAEIYPGDVSEALRLHYCEVGSPKPRVAQVTLWPEGRPKVVRQIDLELRPLGSAVA